MQELSIEIQMQQPRIRFSPNANSDVGFTCQFTLGIRKVGDMNYLVYDQINFDTEFNMEINSEILFANFKKMSVSAWPPTNTVPTYNGLNMTEQQYKEFWIYLNDLMMRWSTFFNVDVFSKGVPLPYWKLSFLTKLTFSPHALLCVVDILYFNK